MTSSPDISGTQQQPVRPRRAKPPLHPAAGSMRPGSATTGPAAPRAALGLARNVQDDTASAPGPASASVGALKSECLRRPLCAVLLPLRAYVASLTLSSPPRASGYVGRLGLSLWLLHAFVTQRFLLALRRLISRWFHLPLTRLSSASHYAPQHFLSAVRATLCTHMPLFAPSCHSERARTKP